MTLNLNDWRSDYIRAARANDVSAMEALAARLARYVADSRTTGDLSTASPPKQWLQLCAEAQTEPDPARLLALVTEINRLLEEEERQKRRGR